MIWDLGGFLEFPLLLLLLLLLLPSFEKKSPCGCHTMFPHPSHLMIWFLYPINCLLHAGHSPLMTKLLATAPMRRGPAIGRTQVAIIITRNSHPERANQRKKIVAKLPPSGVFKNALNCFLYLGKFLLKSAETVLTRGVIPNSRSISRARSAAELAAELKRRETAYWRSIRSAVFLASKTNCSNPSLALLHASLHALPDLTLSAKRSKSPRWKAFTCKKEEAARGCG